MEYRELAKGERIQKGDKIKTGSGKWINCIDIVGMLVNPSCDYRRPLPAATFEESANFEPEFIIGKEPVDKVIHPKVDLPEMNALDVVDGVAVRPKVSEPEIKQDTLSKLIYCLDGWHCEVSDNNQGSAKDWLRHVRKAYEDYQDEQDENSIAQKEPDVNGTDVVERNKYSREIAPGVWVDVYDVLDAYEVHNSALAHLIKKALCVGIRGHKDASEDYQDIIDSAIRAKELG